MGSYGATLDGWGIAAAGTPIYQVIPRAKMGRNLGVGVYAYQGTNYFEINAFSGPTVSYYYPTISNAAPTSAAGFTPQEAYNIDTKKDDGLPSSGNIQATGYDSLIINAAVLAGVGNFYCITTASPAAYNIDKSSGGNKPACGLRIRFN